MQIETSPVVRCSECNSIKKHAEYDEFCEYCEKKLNWNQRSGYEFSINLMGSKDNIDHLNYCSLNCGLRWLSENADEYFVEHRDPEEGEYPHYIISFHKSDELKEFQEVIKVWLTNSTGGSSND